MLDAIKLVGDFTVRIALHFPDRHHTERGIAELVEKVLAFLRHLRGEVGGGLDAQQLVGVEIFQISEAADLASASRPAGFVMNMVDRLAHRQHKEQLPKVVTVLKLGEPSLFGATEEAVENADDDILLISPAPGGASESALCQADKPTEIGVPELLGRLAVAVLQVADQPRDGTFGGQCRISRNEIGG